MLLKFINVDRSGACSIAVNVLAVPWEGEKFAVLRHVVLTEGAIDDALEALRRTHPPSFIQRVERIPNDFPGACLVPYGHAVRPIGDIYPRDLLLVERGVRLGTNATAQGNGER